MLSTVNAMDLHTLIISKIGQQFRCDEEVLARVFFTCNVDHSLVNHTLVAWVHTLVDFIDNTERCSCKRLQRHEVEDRRDGSLSSGLTMLIEELKAFVLSASRI